MAAKYRPDGYHSVTPYLRIKNAGEALEFYKEALNAIERMCIPGPDGQGVMHAELSIGDSIVMLGEPMQGESTTGDTCGLMVYVEDIDKAYAQAVRAGAKTRAEPEDMFYGDRMAVLLDPYGHEWMLATHVEDVSNDVAAERMQKQMAVAR